MSKIKICGLFRDADIDYVNEAMADYAGFVFAESRRQVTPEKAALLRQRLADAIIPVGVFVNAPVAEIAALYQSGVISIAQLHGAEDGEYIVQLKKLCGIPVIKTTIWSPRSPFPIPYSPRSDYLLFDSGAGSGKTCNWNLIESQKITKPWFLAGGIGLGNIKQAIVCDPYAIDISSGAETDGVKDRIKILQLTAMVRNDGSQKGTAHD